MVDYNKYKIKKEIDDKASETIKRFRYEIKDDQSEFINLDKEEWLFELPYKKTKLRDESD